MTECSCPRGGLRHDCPIHGLDKTGLARRKRDAKLERKRDATLRRGASLKQTYRQGLLAGIKRERLYRQSQEPQTPENVTLGPYHCEVGCGRHFETLEDALAGLDLHHEGQARSLGPAAVAEQAGAFDVDQPDGLLLVCNGSLGCHRALEGSDPVWSEPGEPNGGHASLDRGSEADRRGSA